MTEQQPKDRVRVNIGTTAKGAQPEVTIERYDEGGGLDIQRVLDETLEAYGYLRREISKRQMEQWEV